MNFDDRFSAVYPRKAQRAMPALPQGLSLATPLPVIPPTPIPADAIRLDPAATDRWRRGVDQDLATGVVAPPMGTVPPPMPATAAAFPTKGAAPVPYPSGLTLNSGPPELAGWSGTAGLSPAPGSEGIAEAAPSKMDSLAKAIPGLEDIAKGLNPKVSPEQAAAMSTITPMSAQPNQPSALAHDLMNTLLQGRRNRGLTLTGGV